MARKRKATLLPESPKLALPGQVTEPPYVDAEVLPPQGAKSVKLTLEQRRAVLIEKRENQLKTFTYHNPPIDKDHILAETVFENKTIAEWDKAMEAYIENATANKEQGRIVTCDLSTAFPTWVSTLVYKWRARGRPSEYDVIAGEIKKLTDKANELIKFAVMDDEAATQLDDIGRTKGKKAKLLDTGKATKNADKRRQDAIKKRAKADELLKEIEAIKVAWKENHK